MRKPHHYLFIVLLLVCGMKLTAQQGKISGVVRDTSGNAVPSASVTLLKFKDSAFVKITRTDDSGRYVFETIAPDSLLIEVTRVGMKKYISEPFIFTGLQSELVVSDVQLWPNDKNTLGTVVVRGKRPPVEQRIDRTIVNVDAMLSAAGVTALEVLQQSPGIVVNNDGSMSIRGKQGIIVYIDNKPTYLGGQDLANYLRSLPSETLSKIEIMPNPPARYDAAGNAGIINIVTKKIIEKGFNGTLTLNLGQGVYWKTGANANLNYRYNKVNFYGSLFYGVNNDFIDENSLRLFYNPDGSLNTKFVQSSYLKRQRRTANAKLGMDYYIDNNTTLGLVLTGIDRPVKDKWENRNDLLNASMQPDSLVRASNSSFDKWRQGGINVNLRRTLDQSGRMITADVDYVKYKDKIDLLFQNSVYSGDGALKGRDDLIGFLPSQIDIYSGKIDYDHPFKSGIKVNGGVKFSYVKTSSVADYFNRIGNNVTIDYEKTNAFNYDEGINAAYIEMSRESKRFDMQGGLRLENTVANGRQLGNAVKPDSSFKRNYTNLFPTIFLLWRLDSLNKHQLSFNYGRRIQRPIYQSLNPFLFFSDKFTYEAGNPYQVPQFTHSLALSHTFKERYTTTLSYSYIKGLFVETTEQQGFIFITRPDNIGRQINIGLSFSASMDITNWWSANLSADLINTDVKSVVYGRPLDTSITNLVANFTNQFQFKKGWAAEVSGSGRTGSLVGQYTIGQLWVLNLAARKSILKNRAMLRVSMRDVFFSSVVKGKLHNLPQVESNFSNRIDSRMVILSFNYRFGKAYKAPGRYESNISAEEKSRVKSEN
jgi:ferric enterobactin receptor